MNRFGSNLKNVTVEVTTGYPGGDGIYILPGPFVPGQWTSRQLIQTATDLAPPGYLPYAPLEGRLKPIQKCFAQAVTFEDGSVDVLYNPI